MSRVSFFIDSNAQFKRVWNFLQKVPKGTRAEFYAPQRTTPQNSKMWAMLTDIAQQKEHAGRKYTTDQWKALFMHACGKEMQFLPALDGSTFIPWGHSSSKLSKDEMSNLLEFIAAWGAENGVVFHDHVEDAA